MIAEYGGDGPGTSGVLPAARGTSGCGHQEASGSVRYTLTESGYRRMVIVHFPPGYSGKSKLTLVLNLRSSESTSSAEEAFSGMDATADAGHFTVAYPQALIRDGADYDRNIPCVPLCGGKTWPAGAPGDVTFLSTLARDLASRYFIDLNRVYATVSVAISTRRTRCRCFPASPAARRSGSRKPLTRG